MRRNELGELAGAPISEGLTMIRTSFRVALSALLFAGALGLASTGAAQAQSIMKQCGDEWKAAKANNTTNGLLPLLSRRPRPQPISRSRNPCKPLARPALANSARRRKPKAAAPATPWSGLTPRASPTPIITRAHVGTARRSRAPTCARPMLAAQATMRRRAGRNSRNSSPKPGAVAKVGRTLHFGLGARYAF
jgi:hypothetical protein